MRQSGETALGTACKQPRDLPGTDWGEPREDPETVRIKGIEQLHPKNKLFETQDKSITLGAWLLCLLFLSNMQIGLKGLGHRESPDLLRGDPPPRPPTAARDEPQRLPPQVRPDSSAPQTGHKGPEQPPKGQNPKKRPQHLGRPWRNPPVSSVNPKPSAMAPPRLTWAWELRLPLFPFPEPAS